MWLLLLSATWQTWSVAALTFCISCTDQPTEHNQQVRPWAAYSHATQHLEDLTIVTRQAALKEAPAFGPTASRSSLDDSMDQAVSVEQQSASPVVCFRLVHLKPKSQTSVNLLSSLHSDHVAVRLYDVQDVHPETKSICLSSKLKPKPKADDVKLLSLSNFLHMGSEAVAKQTQE